MTIHPGTLLSGYLGGVRKDLAHPRRFLLAAAAISLGIDRLLFWGEAETLDSEPSQKEEGIRKASETALRRADILFEGQ